MKCVECDKELFLDDEDAKVHSMIHLLIEQLNKMSPEYGQAAMLQLLIGNTKLSKEEFLDKVSNGWDFLNADENS